MWKKSLLVAVSVVVGVFDFFVVAFDFSDGWRANPYVSAQILNWVSANPRAVFPTKVALSRSITCIRDTIADIRVVSKDFGLMREEMQTEIILKIECRRNGPFLRKELHLSRRGGRGFLSIFIAILTCRTTNLLSLQTNAGAPANAKPYHSLLS